ncbi:MAG: hypothetical protein HY692_02855, partial [Cyanobacteria bacterium NC_groundwater_1444_Ag_S-0.65um_54_12]|nr:hypothetical protein [Cyanobacteria bacterium NC_groundwater_1444_Ag_S-0.65um_54_12]
MLSRTWLLFFVFNCLASAPAVGAPKATPRPIAKPSLVAPSTKQPPRPQPKANGIRTPTLPAWKPDSEDALVEVISVSPELQGTGQFSNAINWTKRVVTVMGIGIAPERGNLTTRRTLAKAYALEDGLRQLSEAVGHVRVNGDAFVRDLTVGSEEERARINTRIRLAKIVDTYVLSDGSVEIRLQLALFGQDGLAGALLRNEPSPILFA